MDGQFWELEEQFIQDVEEAAISIPHAGLGEDLIQSLLCYGLGLDGADEECDVLVVSLLDSQF